MRSKNEAGVSSLEGLLLLVVVLVIGFVGWYVYRAQNTANNTLANTAGNGNLTSPISTAGWQKFSDDGTKYPATPDGNGDAVGFSFLYPKNWKFYPIGTVAHGAEAAFNAVSPSVTATSTNDLVFSSVVTSLSAKDYFKQVTANQPAPTNGPDWQGLSGFTTKKGYSAYTSKLKASNGTSYETIISNKKGAVIFNYGSSSSNYFSTYKAIFNSVNFL